MDVASRHNVITVDGKRYSGNGEQTFSASACMSCHGSAQYAFVANLYPSPNMVLPEDGQQFLFGHPGSAQWANWFQNRPGDVAMNGNSHGPFFPWDSLDGKAETVTQARTLSSDARWGRSCGAPLNVAAFLARHPQNGQYCGHMKDRPNRPWVNARGG